MSAPDSTRSAPKFDVSGGRRTHFRWVILGLLFFATTVNYLDRNVLGLLAPTLQKLYVIDDVHYGYIQGAFAASYAFGQLIAGAVLDAVGVRVGFALALIAWSAASIMHAFARGALSLIVIRSFLGLAESPNFPASTKTISEWFPRRERAFAFGFVNAGTNMGALAAPMIVPTLAVKYGWQWAFVATGAIGLLWLLLWVPLYRPAAQHPSVSPAELNYIHSDPPEVSAKVPWRTLFRYRGAWAFALGKFLTDSMWWFYITWFPKFLNSQHGLDLVKSAGPLIVIYVMADLGSIAGGWLSSGMIKRGSSVNRARKTAFVVCALGMFPVFFAQSIANLWMAVLVLGLATAAHQGFSSNLYTLVSDLFPRQCVASVAGLGGTAGYFGAALFQYAVGHMVQRNGNYTMPFICAASAYFLATAAIHFLVPVIRPPAQKAL